MPLSALPPLDPAAAEHLFDAGEFARLAAYAGESGLPAIVRERIALACAMTDREQDAERILLELMRSDPGNPGYRHHLGVLYLRGERHAQAYPLLSSCVADLPQAALPRFNLGVCSFVLGRFTEAELHLREYLDAVPDDDVARVYLARCGIEAGDHEAAQDLIEDRTFDQVQVPRDRYELGLVFAALGEPERAEAMFTQLLAEFPDDAAMRFALVAVLERGNHSEAARRCLDGLAKTALGGAHHQLLQGRLHSTAGRWAEALASFDSSHVRVSAEYEGLSRQRCLAELQFERGHALDRLQRYDEAYAAFTDGNLRMRDYFRAQRGGRASGLVIEDDSALDSAVASSRRQPGPPESPIFLVGFPRSGTTLLDQVLDAHPQLQVMEEKPALDKVAAELGRAQQGYPAALLDAGPAELGALREVYWQDVARHLRRRPGTRLVDKYPLNLGRLPLALCLFPDARFIFALRHPCDVVLSCFMQNLRFTEATQGFWSLQQTTEVYVQFIDLWLRQRARLKPDCFDVCYEDMVQDFETGARKLIDFLGLPWDPAVLRYAEHARTRRINTPSYHQVVQPVYRTAMGRWHSYRKHFGKAIEILTPLIAELGYPPPDASGSSGNAASNSGSSPA